HILRVEGYDALSTNRVAKKAGVSIGSLYQYFPSKESLVVALGEQHAGNMTALLLRTVEESPNAGVAQQGRTFVDSMLRVHQMDPQLHRALSEHVQRIAGWSKVHELTQPGTRLVRAWLEANAGQLRPVDLDVATFVLVTAVESITHASTHARPALD